jgi:putative endonuclease
MKEFYVYILTNHSRTLYVGMTNDLARRVAEHAEGAGSGFASKYKLDQLVYFETYARPMEAIKREKQIKGWRREKKIALIEAANPHWEDLKHALY